MRRLLTGTRATSTEFQATAGFFVLLGSLLILSILAYKASGRPSGSLSGRTTAEWLVTLSVASAAAWLLVAAFRRSAGDRRTRFWLPLAMSTFTTLACFVVAEISIRLLARPDPLGVRFGAVTLVPYSWTVMADTNLARLNRFRSKATFFAEDSLLGWTVPADRESGDGMYRSGEGGVRTMRRGEQLHEQRVKRRVVLFGDSYTFSMEVPFEQSWGHYLAAMLPSDTQVLNFGVDGFGVDQTYLRFKREAANWAPTVAVFSLIEDDLYRAVSVYPFFRGWEYPFSRPRFVLRNDSLQLLNAPVISSDSVFGRASIWTLPFLDLDVFFNPENWTWRPLYHSYLVRFVATVLPRWPVPNASTNDDAVLQLGSRIVEEFVREAGVVHAQPIVVYLPSRNDYVNVPLMKGRFDNLLRGKGIPLNDLTPCLSHHVAPSAMFLAGRVHYNAAGNAAVAKCMQPLIASHLQ